MAGELASLDELKSRLDWSLDADEERVAGSALTDASVEARHHGRESWIDPLTAPPFVKTLVLRACKRYMENPNGYTTSRAGDETLQWADGDPNLGTVHFTDDEIDELKKLAGVMAPSFGSVDVMNWGTVLPVMEGFVPVTGEGKPFPFFGNDRNPW